MKNSPTINSSYKEIVKKIYDDPSNIDIVKLLEEAGIEKKKLDSIIVNDFLDESDMAYVMKFLKISSANLEFA